MNLKELHTLGIDIGSTTVKIAILDEENEVLFSDYERHYANIQETLSDLLGRALYKLGAIHVSPVITGSGGLTLAKNLGVPYNLVLFMGLTIAAMITASVVVVVGAISYIGLIVPNIVAMFKGDKIRGTLVDTALFGAIFVLVCDMIGRIVIQPYELPIELIVGIVGSLLFIGLLLYRLKHGRKAVNLRGPETSCCAGSISGLDGGDGQ